MKNKNNNVVYSISNITIHRTIPINFATHFNIILKLFTILEKVF